MNEKYAVEVLVPALGKTLEFMIPSVMDMADAKMLIVKMVSDRFQHLPEDDENLWLIDMKSEKRVPSRSSCKEAGIKDGSKLMLVWIN